MAEKKTKVHVRLRPGPNPVVVQTSQTTVTATPPPTYMTQQPTTFTFDSIFNQAANQTQIFESIMAEPLSTFFEQPENILVFAYGVTSSGKTYTIQGNPENPQQYGILFRTVDFLIKTMQSNPQYGERYQLQLGMLEIYNGQLRDLLIPRDQLPTRPRVEYNITEGTTKNQKFTPLHHMGHFVKYFQHAIGRRIVTATELNSESSRSHCEYKIQLVDNKDNTVVSVVSIFDLAGAERSSKTGGLRNAAMQNETNSINASLMALQDVLKGGNRFRESTLTRLLHAYFSGSSNVHIHMLCCINPSAETYDETLRSLQWAATSSHTVHKSVQHNSAFNQQQAVNPAQLESFQNQLRAARQEIADREKLLADKEKIIAEQTKTIKEKEQLLATYESEDLHSDCLPYNGVIDLRRLFQQNPSFQQLCVEMFKQQGVEIAQQQSFRFVRDISRCDQLVALYKACALHDESLPQHIRVELREIISTYDQQDMGMTIEQSQDLKQMREIYDLETDDEDLDDEEKKLYDEEHYPIPLVKTTGQETREELIEKYYYKRGLSLFKKIHILFKKMVREEVEAKANAEVVEAKGHLRNYIEHYKILKKKFKAKSYEANLWRRAALALQQQTDESIVAFEQIQKWVKSLEEVETAACTALTNEFDWLKNKTQALQAEATAMSAGSEKVIRNIENGFQQHNDSVTHTVQKFNDMHEMLTVAYEDLSLYYENFGALKGTQYQALAAEMEALATQEDISNNSNNDGGDNDMNDDDEDEIINTKKATKKTTKKTTTTRKGKAMLDDSDDDNNNDDDEEEEEEQEKPKRGRKPSATTKKNTKKTSRDESDDEEENDDDEEEDIKPKRGRPPKKQPATTTKKTRGKKAIQISDDDEEEENNNSDGDNNNTEDEDDDEEEEEEEEEEEQKTTRGKRAVGKSTPKTAATATTTTRTRKIAAPKDDEPLLPPPTTGRTTRKLTTTAAAGTGTPSKSGVTRPLQYLDDEPTTTRKTAKKLDNSSATTPLRQTTRTRTATTTATPLTTTTRSTRAKK